MKKYIAKGFLKGEPFEFEDEAADIGSFNQYLRVVYPSFEIKEIREMVSRPVIFSTKKPLDKMKWRCDLNKAIKKARTNLIKIPCVDKFIDEVKGL